uniref:Uncharacterized protein n=1 Tax=Octopus bimaculoides TaxID=37653 RepID=A0A0L8G9X8_OCTBM
MGAILSPLMMKERQKELESLALEDKPLIPPPENQSAKSNTQNKPPILTFSNQTLISILGYHPLMSNLEHQASLSIFQHQPIIEAFQQIRPQMLANLQNHPLIETFHNQPVTSYFGYETLKSPREKSASNIYRSSSTADIVT